MNKELSDRAWACLPREFKEEVKKEYYDCKHCNADACAIELETVFGEHNLTSDAEGEEMLTVSRKKVQEIYAANERLKDGFPKSEIDLASNAINVMLQDLFGAKCLPEPSKLQASCRQVNVDSLHDNVDSSEPKPAEPNPDGDKLSPELQPANRTPASYTQPVTDCPQIDRLHIAAMAMQALLSNADRMKRYEDIASDPLSDNLTRIVARNALRYADALVAETQKGGEK